VLRRIQPRAVARLLRRDVPAPVDVLNVIRTDDRRFNAYRWYGLLVAPAMLAVGGSVRWMSVHERSYVGEPEADKLFVVRYPSHRRFLAMTLNPYYLAINRLREAGVESFQASFMHASRPGGRLRDHERLLVAHFNSRPGEDALEAVAAALPGDLVYAARETARLDFLRDPQPTDPRPLRFREAAFMTAGAQEIPQAALSRVAEAVEELSVQLYRREDPRAFLPGAR
jgi:hypothetical protein